jgi:hypothetical protein
MPQEPVGATLASWQRYLPRNPMLPVLAANAHPHVNNMPFSTTGAPRTALGLSRLTLGALTAPRMRVPAAGISDWQFDFVHAAARLTPDIVRL